VPASSRYVASFAIKQAAQDAPVIDIASLAQNVDPTFLCGSKFHAIFELKRFAVLSLDAG